MSRKNKAQKLLRERSPILYWLVTIAGIVLFTFFMVVLNDFLFHGDDYYCMHLNEKNRNWQLMIMKKIVKEVDNAINSVRDNDKLYDHLYSDYTAHECTLDDTYSFMGKGRTRVRMHGAVSYLMLKSEYDLNISKLKSYFLKNGIEMIYNQTYETHNIILNSNNDTEINNSEIIYVSFSYKDEKMIVSIGAGEKEK